MTKRMAAKDAAAALKSMGWAALAVMMGARAWATDSAESMKAAAEGLNMPSLRQIQSMGSVQNISGVNVAAIESGRFMYNPRAGVCQNAQGRQGFNRVTLAQLQQTKDGECADLGGIALNGDDLGYPKLTGWNLQGANLNKASLYFALLVDADLRGARLDGFNFGYARITAIIDSFTQLSKESVAAGLCKAMEGERLECSN